MQKDLEKEKKTLRVMIEIYCRGQKHKKEQPGDGLCPACEKLYQYGALRTDKCPFGHKKNFCSHCSIKCYGKEEKDEIKKVMRYSGPRMIFRHPIIALRHALKMRKK